MKKHNIHAPGNTPENKIGDTVNTYTSDIQKVVQYILRHYSDPSIVYSLKFQESVRYLNSLPQIWLKRFLYRVEMFEYWQNIQYILHGEYSFGETRNMRNNKAANDDSFLVHTVNISQIRKREIPNHSSIYVDVVTLLEEHLGVDQGSFICQWIDIGGFINHIMMKSESVDYESVIAEYYSDKAKFMSDFFYFINPQRI